MHQKPNAVAQVAASLAGNPTMEDVVKQEIRYNTVVSRLIAMRIQKNLTQEEIAAHMGCDASKISRIESGNDLGLKWVDLTRYLNALNVKMSFTFEDPELPASEKIKQSVFRIHEGLEKLVSLARQTDGDEGMAKKIHQFYGEVLFNFLARYQESYGKLQAITGTNSVPQDVVVPESNQSASP